MGMVNGGLGLALAEVTDMGYLAAYGVVAGVMGSLYLAAIVYGELSRSRKLAAAQSQDQSRKESS